MWAQCAGPGGGPHVRVLRLNGQELASFFAYSTSCNLGVSVGAGMINGKGHIVTTSACYPRERQPDIKVFAYPIRIVAEAFSTACAVQAYTATIVANKIALANKTIHDNGSESSTDRIEVYGPKLVGPAAMIPQWGSDHGQMGIGR